MAGYIGSRVLNSLVTLDGVAISSTTKIQPFIGSVAPFAMSSAPAGWLVCNGAAYSQTTYVDLYNAIESTWVKAWTNGESITTGDYRKNAAGVIYIATSTATTSGSDVGDDTGVTWSSSANFLVPDFRGEFLRGFDNGLGSDPDAASRTGGDVVGSFQDHAVGNHQHLVNMSPGSGLNTYNSYMIGNHSYGTLQPFQSSDPNAGNRSTENRPRNKNVQYCIKF